MDRRRWEQATAGWRRSPTCTSSIGDLPGLALGHTIGNEIMLDVDAAGHGWFIDVSPLSSAEFKLGLDYTLRAGATSAAFERMDLLTVVMHEIGHVLGFEHEDAGQHPVMSESLQAGERLAVKDALHALDQAEAADVLMEQRIAEFEAWADKLASIKQGAGARPSVDFDSLFGPAGGGSKSGVNWSGGLDKAWDRFSPFGDKTAGKGGSNLSDFLSSLLGGDKDEADKDDGYDQLGSSLNATFKQDAAKTGKSSKTL